jgi:thymidylate synthase
MMKIYNTIQDIRDELVRKYKNNEFVIDKTGVKLLEIIGSSFIADEDTIFGKVNKDYVERELQWYNSQSLNVNDIPGEVPQIWQQVSDKDGWINSNYGWCIYSNHNFNQYDFALDELIKHPDSRRACMIYTRPSMNVEYNKNGMSDFCCTNNTMVMIRDNKLHYIVNQRSIDIIYGYKNDFFWASHVHKKLLNDLNNRTDNRYELGDILWQFGSLHMYEPMFYLINNYIKTGQLYITKKEYNKLYKEDKND